LSEAFGEAIDQDDSWSDAALINAVRLGDTAAFGVLYERHLSAARRAATGIAANPVERDDLVAEAFTKVLRVLRAGGGPVDIFRPYLLTTVRNSMLNWRRQDSSMSLVADVPETTRNITEMDPVGARMHGKVAAAAFARLPERWRLVLWHTEIEGNSPAQTAPLLGLTPNGVAALAYRAREGLRQAYLEQHLPTFDQHDCRPEVTLLAGWVRNTLTELQTRRITAHLEHCAGCRRLAEDLTELNQQLLSLTARQAAARLPAS
jgi:RNA polymerase sigma factor (sigma-70 family)